MSRYYVHTNKRTGRRFPREETVDVPHLKKYGGEWHCHCYRSYAGVGSTWQQALAQWAAANSVHWPERPRC